MLIHLLNFIICVFLYYRRAFKIVEPYFEEICLKEQNILETEAQVDEFLKIAAVIFEKENLKNEMLNNKGSETRWDVFLSHYKKQWNKGIIKKNAKHLVEEIMLYYLYPRLDVNVTKGLNHLLKSPFCVHPKSGKISIPFNPTNVDKFSPLTVPTIR